MPDIKEGEAAETVSEDYSYESIQDKADDITAMMKIHGDKSDSTVEHMLNTSDSEVRRAYLEAVADAESGESAGYLTGGVVDELGYRHGGMTNPKRDPIKYAAGGAVRGKRFVGNF